MRKNLKSLTLPLILVTLAVLLQLSVRAQKELTLIIDTVVLTDKMKAEDFHVRTQQFLDSVWLFEDTVPAIHWSVGRYPNYTATVSVIHPKHYFTIPIDADGGTLKISGLSELKNDTLRIDQITLIKPHTIDSTFNSVVHYPVRADSLGNPKKIKNTVDVNPANGQAEKLSPFSIRINGKTHYGRMQHHQQTGEIVHGHGYKPKRYLRKGDQFKGKVTYLYFSSVTYHYYQRVLIDLSQP